MRNLNVVITRPIHQSLLLRNKILQQGGHPIIFPTLEIIKQEFDQKNTVLFSNINDFDFIIFTSQNAVSAVVSLLPLINKPRVVAIGPATAQALLQHHMRVDLVPTLKFDSESLVALLELQQINDKRIAIFTGENGRTFLEEQLLLRGAIVTTLAVYRRIMPAISKQVVERIISLTNCIVVTTSCESLINLIEIISRSNSRHWLYQNPLLMISERMRKVAMAKGLQENLLVLAQNATDQAILESLIKWYSA